MASRLGSVTPILRIFDELKAREFYLDFLGYKIDWQHRFEADFPLYMQVSRDDSILHLSEHHGDGSPGQHLRIVCQNIDEFYAELMAKGYGRTRPALEDKEWGERSFTVIDPFSNQLAYFEPVMN